MTALRFVVIILSAARLTRLTTRDKITEGLRAWGSTSGRDLLLFTRAQRRARAANRPMPPPPRLRLARFRAGLVSWLGALLTCDWCTSVWWAGALAVADRHCHRPGRGRRRAVYQVLTATLGASYAAGWLSVLRRRVAEGAVVNAADGGQPAGTTTQGDR